MQGFDLLHSTEHPDKNDRIAVILSKTLYHISDTIENFNHLARLQAFFERRRFTGRPAYPANVTKSSFYHDDRSRDLVHLECVTEMKRASYIS